MSKMSEIAMELDDMAGELGFESYEEALAKGYEIQYTGEDWVLVPSIDKVYEEVEEEKEKRKRETLIKLNAVLLDLQELHETINEEDYKRWTTTIKDTKKFIEDEI